MSKPLYYGFGVTDRWQNVARKAVEEGIYEQLGKIEQLGSLDQDGYLSVHATAWVLGQSLVNWYRVDVLRTAEALNVACTCRAGQTAKPCKHAAALLLQLAILPWPKGIQRSARAVMEEWVKKVDESVQRAAVSAAPAEKTEPEPAGATDRQRS